MHWIEFEDTYLNLAQVTHIGIQTGYRDEREVRAFFAFGYGANSYAGTDHAQESRLIAIRKTQEECEEIVRDIVAGKYDMKQKPLWIKGRVGTFPQ